ncbi:MAG: dTDP-glucose 4,6-dehydratase [Halothiobacillaceae bacterium]|jgi:dTDP-glucose 4,6-dehydratase
MTTRKLLVTGGAGFIGCNFVHYWIKHHPHDGVIVLDALTYAGNLANLDPVKDHPNFRFVHGDIRDQHLVERLLREEGLDTIVHFAAESHVDRSILGPDAFIETNIIGTHTLLKAAKAIWLDDPHYKRDDHRFHHVSTDEVYGSLGPNDPPFTETTPYAPNSPYSASKAASDHLVRAYHHTYGLKVTTSNCSNNYGPYHLPEKLIPLCMTNILQGKPLPIYGDGLNIRDWLYVEDHVRGIELILEQGQVGEVYNIGGNNEWANIDIVRLICRLMDEAIQADPTLAQRFPATPAARGTTSESLITFVKDRPGHDRRYAIDASKIMTTLGYAPAQTFETGIKATIHWFLTHPDWWQSVLDRSHQA